MKKNRAMRLAALLLVAVLMSTCGISGTFAKYVTSVESEDSARVAKWGFERTNSMDIADLFKNIYDAGQVKSNVDAEDVIAPGTWGMDSFAFAYDETAGDAPEVAYSFVVSTAGSACNGTIQNNASIRWALVKGDPAAYDEVTDFDAEWGTWTELIAEIEALDGDKDYKPGELPTGFTAADETYIVAWKWDFNRNDNGDTYDTNMGNADELAKVKLIISITATQLD